MLASKFTISLDLGNDAMRDGLDIALALEGVAKRLQANVGLAAGDGAPIRDENGNTVGRWEAS